ncbi:MAG TPA: hypothetical protein VHI71_02835 [Actinomycetota bacterium]|nr:hypothetical protein [Actinomycetota bacterium]
MARLRVPRLALATTTLAAAFVSSSALASPTLETPPRRAESFTVEAAGGPHPFTWTWDPDEITIEGRGKVRWENPTEAVHHVTFWRGPSDKSLHVHPGGAATTKFTKPGTYDYLCDIFGHAQIVEAGPERICVGMCGTVTIR